MKIYKCHRCGWSGSRVRMVRAHCGGWWYAVCPDCASDNLELKQENENNNEENKKRPPRLRH